jgi:hypothetical protein
MPTDSVPLALLLLDLPGPKESAQESIWTWPAWQVFSGLRAVPYHRNFNELVKDPKEQIPEDTQLAIISFVDNFRSHPQEKRRGYVAQTKQDQNTVGRKAWKAWALQRWKTWNFLDIIETALLDEGLDPWTAMRADETNEVSLLSCIGFRDILTCPVSIPRRT